MLRGEEIEQRYEADPATGRLVATTRTSLKPGEVAVISSAHGDIHEVRNALTDRPSIGIHGYGANTGAKGLVFDLANATSHEFISGYSSVPVPSIWDRTRDI